VYFAALATMFMYVGLRWVSYTQHNS